MGGDGAPSRSDASRSGRAALPARLPRRGAVCAPHRVRQSRQSLSRACFGAPARDRGAAGDRRVTPKTRQAADHRESVARGAWWRRQCCRRLVGSAAPLDSESGECLPRSAHRRARRRQLRHDASRPAGVGVRGSGGDRNGRAVRSHAGSPCDAPLADGGAQRGHRRAAVANAGAAQPNDSQRARRRRAGIGPHTACGIRGHDEESRESHCRASGLRCGQRLDAAPQLGRGCARPRFPTRLLPDTAQAAARAAWR